MDYVTIIILGIVQGITEFLPISSDGHLVLVGEGLRRWRGISPHEMNAVPVIVALHIGTLFSILLVLRRRVWQLASDPRLFASVVVATVPLVVIGKPLKDQLEALEHSRYLALVAGLGLCVTSAIMFLAARINAGRLELPQFGDRPRGWIDALCVGLLQCIAPLPGVSRSGSTILGGLLRGYSREAAAQFSFLIAVPAIAGAVVLHLPDLAKKDLGTPVPVLIVGVVVSFVVGIVALTWLLRLMTRGSLRGFAWYCLFLGLAVTVWQIGELRTASSAALSPTASGPAAQEKTP